MLMHCVALDAAFPTSLCLVMLVLNFVMQLAYPCQLHCVSSGNPIYNTGCKCLCGLQISAYVPAAGETIAQRLPTWDSAADMSADVERHFEDGALDTALAKDSQMLSSLPATEEQAGECMPYMTIGDHRKNCLRGNKSVGPCCSGFRLA